MILLLLHGFTGDPASWDEVVERLPRATPVLRPALLGHGAGAPIGDGGFLAEVDRIAAWLSARAPEKKSASDGESGIHVVGYSLGARVALGLLARHGEQFARATLIGANSGLSDEKERIERRVCDERWAALVEREGVARFVERWLDQPLFASQKRLPWEVRAIARARRLRHRPEGLAASLRTLGLGAMPDLTPGLAAIRQPVRLLAGAEDEKFRALAIRMSSLLFRGRVAIVPGAGHDLTLERPDEVAAALVSKETE